MLGSGEADDATSYAFQDRTQHPQVGIPLLSPALPTAA